MDINPNIFRANDIRGIAYDDLNENVVVSLGKALACPYACSSSLPVRIFPPQVAPNDAIPIPSWIASSPRPAVGAHAGLGSADDGA